jgi:hypothetical protein
MTVLADLVEWSGSAEAGHCWTQAKFALPAGGMP